MSQFSLYLSNFLFLFTKILRYLMPNQGELTNSKLVLLLTLLFFCWTLCFIAELSLPNRHILDTIDRLQPTNVTNQSYQMAIALAQNKIQSISQQFASYKDKYGIKNFQENRLCVIVAETSKQTSIAALKSIYSQQYANFIIYHFYTNADTPSQIKQYVNKEIGNEDKLKLIENQSPFPLFDHFIRGKLYCRGDDIVIFMENSDRLLGPYVFDLINTHYVKEQANVIYTASLVEQNGQNYRLGLSHPYPQDIIQNQEYRNYPFVMGGLLTLKASVYNNIRKSDLEQEQNHKYFKHLKSIVFGVKVLELSGKLISFLNEPVLLDSSNEIYITNNQTIRKEINILFSQEHDD